MKASTLKALAISTLCFASMADLSALYAQSATITENSAEIAWFDAYAKIEDADYALKNNKALVAFLTYEQARAGFEKISTSFPNWEPSLVAHRIAYCASKMRCIYTDADKYPEEESAQIKKLFAERGMVGDNGFLNRDSTNVRKELASKNLEILRLHNDLKTIKASIATLTSERDELKVEVKKIPDLDIKIADLEMKIEAQKEEDKKISEALSLSLEASKSESVELKTKNADLEESLASSNKDLLEANEANEKSTIDNKAMSDALVALADEKVRLAKQLEEVIANNETREKEVVAPAIEKNELLGAELEKKNSEHQEILKENIAKIEAQDAKVAELDAKNNELTKNLESLTIAKSSADEKIVAFEKVLAEVNQEKNDALAGKNTVEQELASLKASEESLQSQIKGLEANLSSEKEAGESSKQKLAELEKNLSSEKEAGESSKQKIAELEKNLSSQKEINDESQQKIVELEKKIEELTKKKEESAE